MKKLHQVCLLNFLVFSLSTALSPGAIAQSLSAKSVLPKSNFSLIPSIFYGTKSGEFSYGAEAKFSFTKDISARPFAAFSGNSNLSGVAITYDFSQPTNAESTGTIPGSADNNLGASKSNSVWFAGAGGLVRNVAGVSSGIQPYIVVGGDLGLIKVDLKYVFDNSEAIGSAGFNLNF